MRERQHVPYICILPAVYAQRADSQCSLLLVELLMSYCPALLLSCCAAVLLCCCAGMGMDTNQQFRSLDYVAVLKPEAAKRALEQ